jgi:hypothetical protein
MTYKEEEYSSEKRLDVRKDKSRDLKSNYPSRS